MAQQNGSLLSDLREGLANSPAAQRLLDEAQGYVQARARNAVRATTDKVAGLSDRLTDVADNGGSMRKGAEKLAEGKSPMAAAASAGLSKVGEKVKGMLGGGNSSSGGKTVSITEQIDVGVPASVAYNQWTQFQEFGRFAKGVQSANQEDETHVQWRAKIAFSTRSWKSTITEQVPDERIAWTSEGDKGTVDGVVTFHELAPNLTRVLLDLEYHPQGLFEKTGNLWRAQGRRARLDLKKFRQFLMGEGEETGAWRGEIRDGKVVSKGERKKKNGSRESGQRKRSESRERTSRAGSANDKSSGNGKSSGNAKTSANGKTSAAAARKPQKNATAEANTSRKSTSSSSSKPSSSKPSSSKPATSKRSTSATSSSGGKAATNRRSTPKKTASRSTPKKTASRSTSTQAGRRSRAKAGAGSK